MGRLGGPAGGQERAGGGRGEGRGREEGKAGEEGRKGLGQGAQEEAHRGLVAEKEEPCGDPAEGDHRILVGRETPSPAVLRSQWAFEDRTGNVDFPCAGPGG